MQILTPSSGGLYTGLTNAVSTIYRVEGWRTLWKGVSSVIVGAGVYIVESPELKTQFWFATIGPAHAVYFGTYEIVKEMAGGNVDDGHHPLAAGMIFWTVELGVFLCNNWPDLRAAMSGAAATIASDALMNPFDGKLTHLRQ